MSEWKEYKMSDLIDDISMGPFGSNIKVDCFVGQGVPVLNGSNLVGFKLCEKSFNYVTKDKADSLGHSNAYRGDVIVTHRGTLGQIAYIPYDSKYERYVISQSQFRFSCKKELVNIVFLVYYFHSREGQFKLLSNASQVGVPALARPTSTFKEIYIKLPPIEEQKRIAGVLSSLDDKIDLLNRENVTLEALAETLFRHYFIENPDPTWKEGKLGDYVNETIGGEWGKETPEEDYNMPVRCLRGADVADLNDGLAKRTPLRYIKHSKYDKIEPHSGDIILEISGGTDTCSTGRVAYINEDVKRLFDYPIVFSNFCRLLRVKEDYTYFVYCYFRHLHKQGEFFNLENGSSGIHNLNYKAALYDDLGWPVPTDEKLVIEFGENVKPYFDKINTNKKQILSLSAQRDTMLPRLMSGEVKVCER